MTRSRVTGALPAVALVLLAASCGTESSASTPSGTPALRVTDAPALPATVEALPAMDVAGYEELLGQLEGWPVVVNFWATWCDPCEQEMPLLADAARRLDGEVQFVGVDILDTREQAAQVLVERQIPYPNVFDAGGEIRTSLGSFGQPVTAFYAADGSLVRKVDGEISQADLEASLEEITA